MQFYQTFGPRLRARFGTGLVLATATCAALAGRPARAFAPSADPAKTTPAKATVVAFLDSVKRGDDAAARTMLTKVARTKTDELGMSVAPPVADTATYAVKECELIGDSGDIVHVATTWTDVAPDGSKSTEDVIWVVRLDPEGWRVAGMAMRVFDDMPPLLLDFEDPEDMVAKQEMVAAELERRARAEAAPQGSGSRTARGPTSPPARK
ncbi:MAG: hypothetical protein ACKOZU_07675 [Planctomycetaceae bacterium]